MFWVEVFLRKPISYLHLVVRTSFKTQQLGQLADGFVPKLSPTLAILLSSGLDLALTEKLQIIKFHYLKASFMVCIKYKIQCKTLKIVSKCYYLYKTTLNDYFLFVKKKWTNENFTIFCLAINFLNLFLRQILKEHLGITINSEIND